MKNYKELKVWQMSIEVVKQTFRISQLLPQQEKFGTISQMTRAAISIAANIAEGSSRSSDKEYARFLQISLGSAFELQTYFIIAKEMLWIKPAEIAQAENLLEQKIKMIQAFIKKLNNG
jgi:four helix bundle protein